MQTRRLGSSDLEITVVGYGAWEASEHWGPVEEDTIVATIQAALDAGINWIDTAEVYGPHTSERLVGRAIAGRPEAMVATKVAPAPGGGGFAPDAVRRACEASLERLSRDRIDLYQLHWPDREIPVEHTWEAMAGLVEEGLVRAIGVSNFDQERIERCEKVRHVDTLQPHVSMLHRGNLDLVRWCGENGTGAVAYSPLASGLLTGAIGRDTSFHAEDWRAGERNFVLYDTLFGENLDRNLDIVERLKPVADGLGASPADLAIAWVLHQPGITAAIVGSRNPLHVAANARAAGMDLSADTLSELDVILA